MRKKKKSPNSVHRSYGFKPCPNRGKREVLERVLLPAYRGLAKGLAAKHIHHYQINGEIFFGNDIYKGYPSILSERYKGVCNRQVVGMLQSKISNAHNYFTEAVMGHYKLDEDTQMKLCFISKYNKFHLNEYVSENIQIEKPLFHLARKIRKGTFGRWPSYGNINMQLNADVAEVMPSTSKEFPLIVRLSTHIKGQPIWIPLRGNPYSDSNLGDLCKSPNFEFKDGKLHKVGIAKETEVLKESWDGEVLGVDIGLTKLMVFSNGEAHGETTMRQLKRMDARLTRMSKRIRDEGNPKYWKDMRWKRLQRGISAYIVTECNRILNSVIKRHRPSEIRMENLKFDGGLSKRLNRLLKRFGLGTITKKLAMLKEMGMGVLKVDAAYTSQWCSGCGYVDAKNRKSQGDFKCLCCGKRSNADYNGSVAVKHFGERFLSRVFYGKAGRAEKLKLLVADFVRRGFWKGSASAAEHIRLNPYFGDKLGQMWPT